MAKTGLLSLLLASCIILLISNQTVYGQINPEPSVIRSVSTLPATCVGGSATTTSDEVMLITAGIGKLYVCSATNTWTLAGGNTSGGLPTGVANGSAIVSNGVGQSGVYQTKAIADVADYPVVADGSTDVCTSFQAFIDANPGKRLLVRKVAGSSLGGGGASTVDYYSSCTFHLKYNGTILESNVNSEWNGAPVFLFAKGVTGFQIDSSCSGCGFSDIEIAGGGKPLYNATACYSSSNALAYPFTGASDGLLVYGGEPTIKHIESNCNQRDGIHIDGTNVVVNGYAGQPDIWEVDGGGGSSNMHDNLYIHGGDSNAGIERRFAAYNSGGWGVEDNANLGNTHIATFTTANGRDAGIAAKGVAGISSISCSGFVCSVVSAIPVPSISNGIWVVISGTTNYNGSYYVTGYTDTQHFSFTRVAPSVATETTGTIGVDGSTHMLANAVRTVSDASCGSGQAFLYSQSAQFGHDTQTGAIINVAGAGSSGALLTTTILTVWNEYTIQLATNCLTTVNSSQITYTGGISHGPIFSKNQANPIVWIAPYWEGDQPPAKMQYGNNIFGGNLSVDFTYGNPIIYTTGAGGSSVHAQTVVQNALGDTVGQSVIQCGSTINVACIQWFQNYNATQEYFAGGSFGTPGSFSIQEYRPTQAVLFKSVIGGDTSINTDGPGNINFFGLSIGVTQPHILQNGGFYQASQTAPALTLNTNSVNYEQFYTSGPSCWATGESTSNIGIPSSFNLQVCINGITTPKQFISTLPIGTPPFSVVSTTPVPNLNISGNAATATTAGGLFGSPNIVVGAVTGVSAAGFTGNPWYDITRGLTCDGVTDVGAGMQTNLTAAAGGIAYIPALKQCETTITLTAPTNLQGFWIGPGAVLQASGTIIGHGVLEIGAVGQRASNPEFYGGGTIDANGKADYIFWAHNFAAIRIHDFTMKGSNVAGIVLGDVAAAYSDNAWVHDMWIDRPGAVSIPANSIGIVENNSGDSFIRHNTIISYDQGITLNSTNNSIESNHVLARLAYTQAFTDNGIGNQWINDYGDGPGSYCWRMGTTANNFSITGGRCYNGTTAVDNVLVGVLVANAAPVGTIKNVLFYGFSGTNRINKDISSTNGYTNLDIDGNQWLNVTTINGADVFPKVYEAGLLINGEKIYTNTQALTTGTATHTLANSFTYSSSATFGCSCTDQTAANACRAVPASANTVTLAGNGSDVLWLSCSGH